MRPCGSQEQLEVRRRRAVALRQQGCGPSEIARLLNTTPQSVCRWVRAFRRRGEEALAAKRVVGRRSKLNAQQKRALAKCLRKRASLYGFDGDLWTCARVKQLIERRYGLEYHVGHIPRLLASLGPSS